MQIRTEKNYKERKTHGDYGFPVRISPESISAYEGGAFLWHWHPEIELTWIQSGQINYQVNERTYHLRKGQGLFCNSSMLHSGHMVGEDGCNYLSITFHPRFLYGYENSILQSKYMHFITSNTGWSALPLDPHTSWQKEILTYIQQIYHLSKKPGPAYELQVHRLLEDIWSLLYRYYATLPEAPGQSDLYLDRLKEILDFLKNHYADPISLDDIATHAGICKSECCRFFKKHMGMTLFDYLLFYRIQQSLPLLKSDLPITDIAIKVGFSNAAYYSKVFRRYMNCSPREYRKL